MTYDYIIGIDPGTETGWASWNGTKITKCESVQIHYALDWLKWYRDNKTVFVRIEDPTTYVPFRNTPIQLQRARAQGAGSIKRDFAILTDAMRDWGIPFEAVSLHSAPKKLTAEQFRKLTGWTGRTNQHGRDAGCLCWKYEPKTK